MINRIVFGFILLAGTWVHAQSWYADGKAIKEPVVASLTNTAPVAAGLPGQFVVTSNYVYFCLATNTWKRAQLFTYQGQP